MPNISMLSFALLVLSNQAINSPTAGESRIDFQQGVDYRIEAYLDEATQALHGRARLRYANNSPDEIDTLWVHQHLNAFRPNSAWARRELEFDERRFQDLGEPDYAYERFVGVTVDGVAVRAVYPGAPDSTVAAIPLPRALAPGATVEVMMDWEARPSTTPRRQGREGRHYDFAQWYPRIAVFDAAGWHPHPLLPQGEFFGEFASYDVTLDVAADQIVGATGVPVEGDPGWQDVGLEADSYQAEPAVALGLLDAEAAAGRKRIRWRAENVHHFAWSADPEYGYESGTLREISIHVLYVKRGETSWDSGRVVGPTIETLEWLEGIFGPYVYPQLTIVERLERGGTEFPMLVMNGGASHGLIVHEVTHQYAHAILANNEWRDAWLDEGLTSFLTAWFFEDGGHDPKWSDQIERTASLPAELSERPVATTSSDFPSYRAYGAMSYSKASIVFYMLREHIGADAFKRGLRLYYERKVLAHVTEADLKEAMEEATGSDLSWFFEQWLHTTSTLDYALGSVETSPLEGGSWVTRLEVSRYGDAWMPVTLDVDGARRVLDSREPEQLVEIVTPDRPDAVELDPKHLILDADRSNNRWER